MKKVVRVFALLGLFMVMAHPINAQVDEQDCLPLPNLDSVVSCETEIFMPDEMSLEDSDDVDMLLVFRVEYKTDKIADASFDELAELAMESEDSGESDEVAVKPTKAYKSLGIGDALQGEQDGHIVVMLRDDKAIIVISTNLDEDQVERLIEMIVEEDEIPEEFEGLTNWIS